ncbi:hypothetical protein C1H57_08435 [Clostridium sp. 2-1]|uniref:Uncharacterized protein n=1 Tax=Candidatus Clostridium helianthi TaxID=3381660 RepID=A0ABW8SBU7_9CLOT|nr:MULTISPECIES: hypothetical protein [Clostridium]MBN7575434.1 hypothetical protein [Clostridium beijerinckii]MBN7580745.1 hypothetical protein [Clostridium beijerinckii]MBN7585198.1 hypothetical protein [Clostridium beijerinckii]MBO0521996.1 hypothetical protein [Clostridium beijerinckii]NRT77666.1 hypothetical protein [Clostridium beijerinckii]
MSNNIKDLLVANGYGFYTAASCRETGLPMLDGGSYKKYADKWLSASRCKRIRQPVKEDEEPVAFYRCQKGYCSLYNRENTEVKNLLEYVTQYQLDIMRHCVGIGRKNKPYRNYFFTQETDKDWNELVQKGLAEKGTNHPNNDECIYFWLSKQGLELILGRSVSDKFYKEL